MAAYFGYFFMVFLIQSQNISISYVDVRLTIQAKYDCSLYFAFERCLLIIPISSEPHVILCNFFFITSQSMIIW